MNFQLPEELRDLGQRVREFVRAEVIPLENDRRQDAHGPHMELVRELQARGKAAGLWSLHAPAEYGGGGLGHLGRARFLGSGAAQLFDEEFVGYALYGLCIDALADKAETDELRFAGLESHALAAETRRVDVGDIVPGRREAVLRCEQARQSDLESTSCHALQLPRLWVFPAVAGSDQSWRSTILMIFSA